jgi:hypothetical protein
VAYSVASGIGFFIAFAAIASGRASPTIVLRFYAAVIWIWAWHALVSRKLLDEATGP